MLHLQQMFAHHSELLAQWGTPAMGGTCGCVREPGSRTHPFGVGCIVFWLCKKTIHPTRTVWHAGACAFAPMHAVRATVPPLRGHLSGGQPVGSVRGRRPLAPLQNNLARGSACFFPCARGNGKSFATPDCTIPIVPYNNQETQNHGVMVRQCTPYR
jgi:hypothetical protein